MIELTVCDLHDFVYASCRFRPSLPELLPEEARLAQAYVEIIEAEAWGTPRESQEAWWDLLETVGHRNRAGCWSMWEMPEPIRVDTIRGRDLEESRQRLGLTRRTVARRLSSTVKAVKSTESRDSVGAKQVARYAAALGVTVEEILKA